MPVAVRLFADSIKSKSPSSGMEIQRSGSNYTTAEPDVVEITSYSVHSTGELDIIASPGLISQQARVCSKIEQSEKHIVLSPFSETG